jgi:hypothetical protein
MLIEINCLIERGVTFSDSTALQNTKTKSVTLWKCKNVLFLNNKEAFDYNE